MRLNIATNKQQPLKATQPANQHPLKVHLALLPCLRRVLPFVCTSAAAAAAIQFPRGGIHYRGQTAAANCCHQKAAEQPRQQILHLKRNGPEKKKKTKSENQQRKNSIDCGILWWGASLE